MKMLSILCANKISLCFFPWKKKKEKRKKEKKEGKICVNVLGDLITSTDCC